MKKHIKIVLIAVLPFFASCEDFLDKGPLSTLAEKSYWQKGSDAEYAVNGMYEAFSELERWTNAPYLDMTTDLMYLKAPWEFLLQPFNTGSLTSDNGWIEYFWTTKYQYIRDANFFFENVDRVKDQLTEESYNNYCGQARVVRAFCYLRLVQGFGDVPLITRTLDYDEWLPRNSSDTVMEFVIGELGKAVDELPDNQSDERHGRIDKYVAYAYQARAALHYAGFYEKTEYYQVAADALDALVTSGKFALYDNDPDPVENFTQIFWSENEGADNREIIFSDQYIKDKRPHNISTSFAGPGWKGHQAQQNFIDMFENKAGWQSLGISFETMNKYRNTKLLKSPLEGVDPNYNPKNEFANRDPRLNATFFNPNIFQDAEGNIQKAGEFWEAGNYHFSPDWDNDCYFYKKLVDPICFNQGYYYGQSENNYPLVRYSDMLLLFAEVLNELGTTSSTGHDALYYVNLVRTRADMPDVVSNDKDEIREIIKHERKIELIGEQVLPWDYKRWKEYERTMEYGSEFYGFRRETYGQESVLMQTKYLTYPKYHLWPIPAIEMRNNPNITENNSGW